MQKVVKSVRVTETQQIFIIVRTEDNMIEVLSCLKQGGNTNPYKADVVNHVAGLLQRHKEMYSLVTTDEGYNSLASHLLSLHILSRSLDY